MAPPEQNFPPVRACIFDMDGLLINTEDMYTLCADIVLQRHGRPPLPWSVKAKLMGVPGSSTGEVFHAWAQLPIPREQFRREQFEQHSLQFPECRPLPGAEALLEHLVKGGGDGARNTDGLKVEVALATSSARQNFELKTSGREETRRLLGLIPEQRRVLGDDPRLLGGGRGKPAPDIYLLALEAINDSLPLGAPRITPAECLVFEDSVPGVEAGRRAGMRVIWVPHDGLAGEFRGREEEVLAGMVGLVPIGDEHQLGTVGDEWGEKIATLEDFDYGKYGIMGP